MINIKTCSYDSDDGECDKPGIYTVTNEYTEIKCEKYICEEHIAIYYNKKKLIFPKQFYELYLTSEEADYAVLDWLQENGETQAYELIKSYYEIPKILRTHDWNEVFKFSTVNPALPNDKDVKLDIFTRKDIKDIYYLKNGNNDSADWLISGQLKDNRQFFTNASCCYTGWGLSNRVHCIVSMDLPELINMGIDRNQLFQEKWRFNKLGVK